MKKIIYLLHIALFAVLLTACYESEPVTNSGEPLLFKLQDSNTWYADTLTLYGENLGLPADSSYLVLNDTTIIQSKDCLRWTASKIEFIVPKLPSESTIYVVVNGNTVFYDSVSYYQQLSVTAFPAFDYAFVPVGNFNMGSDEFTLSDEKPIHNVLLNASLYVSCYEVSQHLYSTMMGNNPSDLKHGSYPVYNVTWIDAIRFCNTLSLAAGLAPAYTIIESSLYVSFDTTANGWRLPTEAEWEYFSAITLNTDTDINDYAWFASNSSSSPKTTGLLKPNSFGLYDVLGNVWEWCWDYYAARYYDISPVVNPLGPATGENRVIRGGSCDDGKVIIRNQYRAGCLTINKDTKIGFRIVRKAANKG